MQDRYVGDIGDYFKLALLRAMLPNVRLGIAWWLYPNEKNADGKHIKYLDDPKWRYFDSSLFDALAEIVGLGNRCTNAIERAGILENTTFYSAKIPNNKDRAEWFKRLCDELRNCDVIFLDPDNGFKPERATRKLGKYVLFQEINDLLIDGRCLIVYHHHTRWKDGHSEEVRYLRRQLAMKIEKVQTVDVVRARSYSPRAFFLLNAPSDMLQRTKLLVERWEGKLEWHPDPKHQVPISPRA